MRALTLDDDEQAMRDGWEGKAKAFAMDLLCRVAYAQGAKKLLPITQAHLVGSYHSGHANLSLLRALVDQGAQVCVPTTLNASGADLSHPQYYAEEDSEFRGNCDVVKLHQKMGCRIELTCAPYHLPIRPERGDNIAWAESNAVVFANSVIGARTNMSYQYLDLCAAIAGRIPATGLYLDQNRAGETLYSLDGLPKHWLSNDAFYQLLGLVVGRDCGHSIPVLSKLPTSITEDQLRGFSAAAAAAGSVAMFHAIGVTPEAPDMDTALHGSTPKRVRKVQPNDISQAYALLSSSSDAPVAAVCLGAPHLSREEFQQLSKLIGSQETHPSIRLLISTSRHVWRELQGTAIPAQLLEAGAQVVVDTCTYYGSLVREVQGQVLTNSAKWAYYGPGNLGLPVQFASMNSCVEAAINGRWQRSELFFND